MDLALPSYDCIRGPEGPHRFTIQEIWPFKLSNSMGIYIFHDRFVCIRPFQPYLHSSLPGRLVTINLPESPAKEIICHAYLPSAVKSVLLKHADLHNIG